MKNIYFITGRDRDQVDVQISKIVRATENMPVVVRHPWTDIHPTDGLKFLRAALDNEFDLVIVSFQAWIVEYLGEMIERGDLDREHVQVIVADSSDALHCTFDQNGCLVGDWPIGYFCPDTETNAHFTRSTEE